MLLNKSALNTTAVNSSSYSGVVGSSFLVFNSNGELTLLSGLRGDSVFDYSSNGLFGTTSLNSSAILINYASTGNNVLTSVFAGNANTGVTTAGSVNPLSKMTGSSAFTFASSYPSLITTSLFGGSASYSAVGAGNNLLTVTVDGASAYRFDSTASVKVVALFGSAEYDYVSGGSVRTFTNLNADSLYALQTTGKITNTIDVEGSSGFSVNAAAGVLTIARYGSDLIYQTRSTGGNVLTSLLAGSSTYNTNTQSKVVAATFMNHQGTLYSVRSTGNYLLVVIPRPIARSFNFAQYRFGVPTAFLTTHPAADANYDFATEGAYKVASLPIPTELLYKINFNAACDVFTKLEIPVHDGTFKYVSGGENKLSTTVAGQMAEYSVSSESNVVYVSRVASDLGYSYMTNGNNYLQAAFSGDSKFDSVGNGSYYVVNKTGNWVDGLQAITYNVGMIENVFTVGKNSNSYKVSR